MSLLKKLEEVKNEFPEVKECIKGCGGSPFTVTAIDYEETDKYKIVVAKWDQWILSTSGGGRLKNWIILYYKEKQGRKVKSIRTKEMITIDYANPKKESKNYHLLFYVSILDVRNNLVKVLWHDGKGKGILYEFDLEKRKVIEVGWKKLRLELIAKKINY